MTYNTTEFRKKRQELAKQAYELFKNRMQECIPDISYREELKYMCDCFKNCVLIEFQDDAEWGKE